MRAPAGRGLPPPAPPPPQGREEPAADADGMHHRPIEARKRKGALDGLLRRPIRMPNRATASRPRPLCASASAEEASSNFPRVPPSLGTHGGAAVGAMGGAKSMGGTGRGGAGPTLWAGPAAEGGAPGGAARALPRPPGLVPPVTGPAVVVPGVHLVFLLKVKPVRAVVSARAFAAGRVVCREPQGWVGGRSGRLRKGPDRQGGGGPRRRGPGEGRGAFPPDPRPWP